MILRFLTSLDIEKQIRELGIGDGYILFDTLLSKGNISTRFLKQNLKMVNLLSHLFKILKLQKVRKLEKASEFYRESGINLNNSLANRSTEKNN